MNIGVRSLEILFQIGGHWPFSPPVGGENGQFGGGFFLPSASGPMAGSGPMRPSVEVVAGSGDDTGLSGVGTGASGKETDVAGRGTALSGAGTGAADEGMGEAGSGIGTAGIGIGAAGDTTGAASEGAGTGAGSCRRDKAALSNEGIPIACTEEVASNTTKSCDVCMVNNSRVL